MNTKSPISVITCLLLILGPVLGNGIGTANAQAQKKEHTILASKANRKVNQYAAKFSCGESDGLGAVKGLYETSVSIHNPIYKSIVIAYKVAVGLSEGNEGPISTFRVKKLGADGVIKFTCKDINQILTPDSENSAYLTGYFVVLSSSLLDVTSVITLLGPTGQSLDVIDVNPKEVVPPKFPDLKVSGLCVFEERLASATIKNIGGASSQASTTRIILTSVDNGGNPTGFNANIDLTTPSIPSGGQTTVQADLPAVCFSPNCRVEATADVLDDVNESNESNNNSEGEPSTCIG